MALRVWLPLNGNFKNQGTSLFTSPSLPSGASWGDGKLGKGLVINNAGSSSGEISDLAGLQKFTICFWYKIPSGKTFTQWSDLVYNNASSVLRLEVSNTSGTSTNWFGFGMDAGGLSGQTVTLDTWYHEAITVNGTTLTRYVNGVQKGQKTAGSQATLGNTIKLGDTGMYCTLCDLRIYDECLSPKQIHEISKGLIAHYKLEGIGANPNLFKNTLNATHSSSGAVTGSSSSANFSLDSTATAANLAGKQVTISVDIDAVDVVANEESGGHRAGTEIAFSRSGGGTTYLGAWQTFTDTASTVRKKLVATGTIPSDWTGGLTERNMYIQRLASGTVKLSNLKIEIGGVATDWTPSVDDAIYSKLGFNNMLLEDVSGNGYNATKVGTLNFDSTAPRYNGGSGCATGIDGLKTDLSISGMPELTISFWVKPNASNGGYCCIMSPYNNPAGAGLWIATNCEGCGLWAYRSKYTAGGSLLTAGTWYHAVYVFNKGTAKWYLNGVEQTLTKNTYTDTTIPLLNNSIGNTYTGTGWNTKNYGSLSDFRIYATALSAADVKQLYDTAGFVDNTNNMYAYEFKEE